MQAYTKSAMPFLGVTTPARRKVCREMFAGRTCRRRGVAPDGARALARRPLPRGALRGHRPHRARSYRAFQGLDAVPMYEEMIVTGAWWDYVDAIAAHRIGPLLAAARAMRG